LKKLKKSEGGIGLHEAEILKSRLDLAADSFSYFKNNRWLSRFDYYVEGLGKELKVNIDLITNMGTTEKASCTYSMQFDGVVDMELKLNFNE